MVLQNDPVLEIRKKRMCPCGKSPRNMLQRIPRTWYMRTFLFWLGTKRYKCAECNQKRILFN
jgi:hypothetical protein